MLGVLIFYLMCLLWLHEKQQFILPARRYNFRVMKGKNMKISAKINWKNPDSKKTVKQLITVNIDDLITAKGKVCVSHEGKPFICWPSYKSNKDNKYYSDFFVTDEKLKKALDDLAVKLYDDEKDSSVTIR